MDKKEEFKTFINKHPELIEYIKNKEMTMQNFYELYDVYGESEEIWNKYFNNSNNKLDDLSKLVKKINIESIEHHVNNAQKVLDILNELTKKTPEINTTVSSPVTKFFGD